MESKMGKEGLIIKLNSKDKKAFEEVYRLYHQAIYLFAYKNTKSLHEAEDIAADSFIKLYNSNTSFETLSHVKSFLYLVTRNACQDYHRSFNRKLVLTENMLDLKTSMDDPFHQITAELIQVVTKYIENLPKKRKKIMEMILLQGLNDKQIATYLDIDPKTVRNQKNTAIQYLRQEIPL